jgi:hypothetical protein
MNDIILKQPLIWEAVDDWYTDVVAKATIMLQSEHAPRFTSFYVVNLVMYMSPRSGVYRIGTNCRYV